MRKALFAKAKKFGFYHLNTLALEAGVAPGRQDYEKFIILAVSRTGSELLRDLLNSHSQIIAFGELFRRQEFIAWDLPIYSRLRSHSTKMLSLLQNDPIKFTETHVYGPAPRYIKAVGLKIFYYHAKDGNQKDIWSYFRDRKDLKILHLKRKNILKRLVSLEKAKKTNVWQDKRGRTDDSVYVHLDFEKCQETFKKVKKLESEYDRLFEGHRKMQIVYEDLSRDPETVMGPVQEFLNVRPESLRASIYKQSTRSISETVSNYDELKRRFNGTAWAEFFED